MRRAVLIVLCAVFAAGCGGHKEDFITEAETEGVYVDVGNLVYQVQLSRYLNPGDIEDKEYLVGLPEGIEPELGGEEIWFGVWMRVKNYTDDTLTPASTFKIVDTEGNEFEPVELDNIFAYSPDPLAPGGILPVPDTAAASGPIQGSLVLFRLPTDSLQNRPLRLEIEQEGSKTAEIDLDL